MEDFPNFEVTNCSQTSDLGQDELDEIEQKAQSKNTKRATNWGLNKFTKWCNKRSIIIDFKLITPEQLNQVLRKFYAEVKSEKGQPLTPSALTGIRAAIHRHITSAPLSRNMNILQDSDFMSANKMFESKTKLFTKDNNVKPQHKASIETGDMEKIAKYFREGQSDGVWTSNERLLEFVWFTICFHFGRRGREGWRELTKHSFEIKSDDRGVRYLAEKLTEQTKNHQGGSKQSDQLYSDVRMYETSTALDPVAAFEFYLTKSHPGCEALLQTTNKLANATSNTWYKNEPLGKNTISKIMERISSKAGLSQRYTNHCVRASTVTSLYQRGVDTKTICTITKHKDERSLSHYISGTTSEQKRETSRLLTEAFQSGDQQATTIPTSIQTSANQFISMAQPYCTQHIHIETMNVYHGEPKPTEINPPKRRRICIQSESDSD